ncbi:hypothetical protein BB558_001578 [Smittium angustum]|uniref:Endonuclease/exonuclease/phosphatase domain-containing protein n=1 Tax=Smittium angustum TaxID=133377 RepID=A0A2U1JBE1_SMIAN|nr:hypothetical protein BB558_001578 [Smittium angustum]
MTKKILKWTQMITYKISICILTTPTRTKPGYTQQPKHKLVTLNMNIGTYNVQELKNNPNMEEIFSFLKKEEKNITFIQETQYDKKKTRFGNSNGDTALYGQICLNTILNKTIKITNQRIHHNRRIIITKVVRGTIRIPTHLVFVYAPIKY